MFSNISSSENYITIKNFLKNIFMNIFSAKIFSRKWFSNHKNFRLIVFEEVVEMFYHAYYYRIIHQAKEIFP
jgi:hypothetical protein